MVNDPQGNILSDEDTAKEGGKNVLKTYTKR